MADITQTLPSDDTRARRNVGVLVAAQALMGAQMPIAFVLGGLAGQMLADNKLYATLPISVIVVVSMFASPALSQFMGRFGRRAGFIVGALSGALAGVLCTWALVIGNFELLVFGHAFIGVYMSAQAFYRFAAADTASAEFRPKAISWVMAGGLGAALLGPQMVILFGDALAPYTFAGGYVSIVVLNLIGIAVLFLLDIPAPPRRTGPRDTGRPLKEIMLQPKVVTAVICAMVSYALMNLMMTSTPLAVVGCGFSTDTAADVVRWHVVAMFAPSFFTGSLIARFGAERIIGIGLAILLGAGLVALAGVDLFNFYAALILLGIGWNFGFIGATTLLASAHTAEERAKVQGTNDFLVFGLVAIASFSSGGLMNGIGADDVVVGWTAVNVAMVPFLVLAGATLVW
ncbi:MAG: MFS transporter, partial [Pseudomonadota bacterium]